MLLGMNTFDIHSRGVLLYKRDRLKRYKIHEESKMPQICKIQAQDR